jgi:hypothetical protein
MMAVWDFRTQRLEKLELGTFRHFTRDPDLQGILWVLNGLQQRATASTHILYCYGEIINRVHGLSATGDFRADALTDTPAPEAPEVTQAQT